MLGDDEVQQDLRFWAALAAGLAARCRKERLSKLFRNVPGLNYLEMSSGSNQVQCRKHWLGCRVAEPRSEAERFRHPEWNRQGAGPVLVGLPKAGLPGSRNRRQGCSGLGLTDRAGKRVLITEDGRLGLAISRKRSL